MILFDTKESTIMIIGGNLDRRMETPSISEEPGHEILANRTRRDLGSGGKRVVGGKEPCSEVGSHLRFLAFLTQHRVMLCSHFS